MRIWDLPVSVLCRQHILAEHRELHAIWSVLTKNKKGYSRHPETLRWKGKLKALYLRHEAQCAELARRGYRHKSPLDAALALGESRQLRRLVSPKKQLEILKQKNCGCAVRRKEKR